MCYGGVCGRDGELFGQGCESFPKLVKRMADIGKLMAPAAGV